MSAGVQGAGARKAVRSSRRARRPDEIPLRLYGLRRRSEAAATAACALFGIFTLVPIAWLVVNATKTQANVEGTFAFWFARPFVLWHNLSLLFQNLDAGGTFLQWFANTALYAGVAGVGATIVSALGGYGFARYRFRGSRLLFYVVLSALLVPVTAITLPLYLVYAKVKLINSIWGMILPSMVTPVGIYLMRTFADASVPRELIDSARIDGAGELSIFVRIGLPLMVPGLVTVLLLSIVGVWNNYFLPLIIFSRSNLYPLTVGLGLLSDHAEANGTLAFVPLVITGSLVTILPLVILFVVLQRYWRGGLLFGSTTG
ncbi:MAG TPA: carbohydrate ABC transporter permease [Acidimicrobiales bacterium]|nr:carbohydrate ABC transporter permease [Acidimicrobiales bacterium]